MSILFCACVVVGIALMEFSTSTIHCNYHTNKAPLREGWCTTNGYGTRLCTETITNSPTSHNVLKTLFNYKSIKSLCIHFLEIVHSIVIYMYMYLN